MDINSSQKGKEMYLELEKSDVEFIASELHHFDTKRDKKLGRKALRIGNEITEQLIRQKQKREERERGWH